jgi:hypothetical protein
MSLKQAVERLSYVLLRALILLNFQGSSSICQFGYHFVHNERFHYVDHNDGSLATTKSQVPTVSIFDVYSTSDLLWPLMLNIIGVVVGIIFVISILVVRFYYIDQLCLKRLRML